VAATPFDQRRSSLKKSFDLKAP